MREACFRERKEVDVFYRIHFLTLLKDTAPEHILATKARPRAIGCVCRLTNFPRHSTRKDKHDQPSSTSTDHSDEKTALHSNPNSWRLWAKLLFQKTFDAGQVSDPSCFVRTESNLPWRHQLGCCVSESGSKGVVGCMPRRRSAYVRRQGLRKARVSSLPKKKCWTPLHL